MTQSRFVKFAAGRARRAGHFVLLCVVLSYGSDAIAHKGERELTSVTVLVNNSADVSLSVLRQAEAETSRVFRAAQIEVEWIHCQDSTTADKCRRIPTDHEFVLHLVPRRRSSSDSIFGEAFLGQDGDGKYCDIFIDRIEEASRSGQSRSRLLGAVAAHELGHLLLGSHAHSHVGIMTPEWNEETLRRVGMGSLLFTGEQAARMKQRVRQSELELARVNP